MIAQNLSALPGITIPAKSQGPGDNPGGTHLVKVSNPDVILQQLIDWITQQIISDDGNTKI
jgi:hypothetical protein